MPLPVSHPPETTSPTSANVVARRVMAHITSPPGGASRSGAAGARLDLRPSHPATPGASARGELVICGRGVSRGGEFRRYPGGARHDVLRSATADRVPKGRCWTHRPFRISAACLGDRTGLIFPVIVGQSGEARRETKKDVLAGRAGLRDGRDRRPVAVSGAKRSAIPLPNLVPITPSQGRKLGISGVRCGRMLRPWLGVIWRHQVNGMAEQPPRGGHRPLVGRSAAHREAVALVLFGTRTSFTSTVSVSQVTV